MTQAGVEKAIKARKAVVVAAGGFEFNNGDGSRTSSTSPECYSYGSPHNTGETIKMCWDAGAAPRNMAVIAAPTYRSAGVLPGYKGALALADTIERRCVHHGRPQQQAVRRRVPPARHRHPEQGHRRPRRHDHRTPAQEIRDGAYVQQAPARAHALHLRRGRQALDEAVHLGRHLRLGRLRRGLQGQRRQQRRAGQRLDHQGRHHRGARRQDRARPRRAAGDDRPVERVLRRRQGRRSSTSASRRHQGSVHARPAARLVPFTTTGPFYAIAVHRAPSTRRAASSATRSLRS